MVTLSLGVAALALSSAALGHVADSLSVPTSSAASVLGIVVPLLLSAYLYAAGYLRYRAHTTGAQGRVHSSVWRAVAFFTGVSVLAASLLSPLDRWSSTSFAFHMTQHELLMLVAAPLMVWGRPLPCFLWAFPSGGRAVLSRLVRTGAIRQAWKLILNPLGAWVLHAAVLWTWHAPVFFDAAVRSSAVHDLQHLTFLASALIFWSALFEERIRERQGAAVLYLFTTTIHTGVLGAFLTFATRPWYSAYFQLPPQASLSPLEDQQLGGLIMWVPASLVYVGVGLALLARWIQSSETPARRLS